MNKKPVIKNDNLIRALLRQPVAHTPIWIMRQAGRYLPEYRALRAQTSSFLEFCYSPDLVCEATMQPLKRFPLDGAIIFSDILILPAKMGVSIAYQSGGPIIEKPLRTESAIHQFQFNDLENFDFLAQAIKRVLKAINGKVPLIGFAGSPWTVACYLVEGSPSKTFSLIKSMLYREPALLTLLLEKLTEATIQLVNLQIKAGVDVIMLFDTWGGILTKEAYEQFSLYFMEQIGKSMLREWEGRKIPLIFFTKNAGSFLEKIAESACDAVGLDWTIDMDDAKKRIGTKVSLQGNLDPCILLSNQKTIQEATETILKKIGNENGHVFNLGHGIDKDTPIENVEFLIDTVHHLTKRM